MSKKIYIVIPTYNEAKNIENVLEKIFDLKIDNLSVLVIDDNSPDGTGKIVEKLKIKNPAIDIMHRPGKAGLGRAYVAGFKEALSRGADYIIQMDADLSHDPRSIPSLIAAAADNDLVIGSRYIAGGGTSNWNFARRMVSRFGNRYARFVLGLKTHDITGGFRCYRRAVLEKIDLDRVDSVGFNFQIEVGYKAIKAGFKVKEVPIIFAERLEGKSKFSLKIFVESFWKVLKLKRQK
ncbi:MAG: polyprenol monophosphomannose synthase [Candidatus Buchananbacteria bacterium]|nr:polyprenol monophosphomannose synthase [Candidatus Buchananbacteria bacterium]